MLDPAVVPPRPLRLKACKVFGAVLLGCLLVQGWVWTEYWPFDYWLWVDGVRLYSTGDPTAYTHPVHLYPATTIMLPAGALAAAGVSEDRALRVTMPILLSLVAALTATAAYVLRPRTLWWAFVGLLLTFQSLYSLSTPASTLLAPLVALFAFLILHARERGTYTASVLAGIGICGGAMVATRLDLGAAFLGAGTLDPSGRRRAALWAVPLCALASLLLFGPELLFSPVERLSHIFRMVSFHAQHVGQTNAIESIHYASLFGVVSLVVTAVLLFSRRLQFLPVDFALFLGATSAFIAAVLFAAKHHPPWLFYPAFLVWELLLPLAVMDGIRALPERSALRALSWPNGSGTGLALAFMLYQGWTFYFRVM